jgi:hypothetical protein
MRRLMLGAALVGATGVLLGAANPSIPTVVVDVGYGHKLGSSNVLTIRPDQATPTGDGTLWWEHLHWWTWGGATATATGGFAVKSCTPNCAQGKLTHYGPGTAHARLVADRPRTLHCDGHTVRAYTRYVFTGRQVQHGLKTSWRLHVDSTCRLKYDD